MLKIILSALLVSTILILAFENNGSVDIQMMGYQITTSTLILILLILALVLAIFTISYLWGYLWGYILGKISRWHFPRFFKKDKSPN